MSDVSHLTQNVVDLAGAWLPGDTTDPVFPIGDGYRHDHQREMYDYISDTDHDVVLNTNPTGGGKTLSWGAPVIRSAEYRPYPMEVIATYPTAALVEDQRESLIELFEMYFGSPDPQWASKRDYSLAVRLTDREPILTNGTKEFELQERVQALTSSTTTGENTGDTLAEAHKEAMRARLAGVPTIILTTPDTLTLIASNRFRDRAAIAAIPGEVDMIVVDEFHLANPRGKRMLPFHLDTYLTMDGGNLSKLVFLSATPVSRDIDRLERAFSVARVTDDVHASNLAVPNWQILPEAQLGIETRPIFSSGDWLVANIDRVLQFYDPDGQTLIILDSVREVELVKHALETLAPHLAVGQVYGWKKHGRQDAINNSDILVGNTTVEVGVDFQNVNRLIFTAYDPNTALQRLGRMRQRDHLHSYEALFITSADVYSELLMNAATGRFTRTELDQLLQETMTQKHVSAYYDSLCGAYTNYLWNDADNPLKSEFRPQNEPVFQDISHRHFGDSLGALFSTAANVTTPEFWEYLQVFKQQYNSNGSYPVFEEMHSYRASSLSCLVLDVTDSEEPLKRYSLHHVLRHRTGQILEEGRLESVFKRHFGRELTDEEEWFIADSQKYTTATVLVTGEAPAPRDYNLRDYRFEQVKSKEWTQRGNPCLPGVLRNPVTHISPMFPGQQHLDLAGNSIIAQYVGMAATDTRSYFNLGPYTATCPVSDTESLLLGQDAILAHCQLMVEKLKSKGKQPATHSPRQSP